jgi:hypothetical protein
MVLREGDTGANAFAYAFQSIDGTPYALVMIGPRAPLVGPKFWFPLSVLAAGEFWTAEAVEALDAAGACKACPCGAPIPPGSGIQTIEALDNPNAPTYCRPACKAYQAAC